MYVYYPANSQFLPDQQVMQTVVTTGDFGTDANGNPVIGSVTGDNTQLVAIQNGRPAEGQKCDSDDPKGYHQNLEHQSAKGGCFSNGSVRTNIVQLTTARVIALYSSRRR